MFDTKTKILIVDDMLSMRKMIIKMCKEMGFSDLVGADDGDKAWEEIKVAEQPFGLIISDWNMPNVTGLELLKKVRADGKFQKTPFLMLTAEAEGHQVAAAVAAGVDGYVVKPFAQVGLHEKMVSVFKKRSA